MEGQEEKTTRKTWKPTTAGILSIIAGILGVLTGLMIAGLGEFAAGMLSVAGFPGLGGLVAAAAAISIILGIVAIVGGSYAMKRRVWGLALVGSICALFCFWILGILAIIFVAMGKGEFR